MIQSLRFLPALWFAFLISADGCAVYGIEEARPAGVLGVVFPALCATFIAEEGFDDSTVAYVVQETRPVFETFALRVLREAGALPPAEAEQDDALDAALKANFNPSPVALPPEGGPCRWRATDRPTSEYLGSDFLVLELSGILEDPFAPVEGPYYGLFAKLSIGGASGASWYWVALARAGSSWEVVAVSRLDINEL